MYSMRQLLHNLLQQSMKHCWVAVVQARTMIDKGILAQP